MLKHLYDKSDMKSVITSLAEQISKAYAIETNIRIQGLPDYIIICGMGGSSISGQILSDYLTLSIPIITVADYHIPQFATRNSLIFIISYSGNTEETIACYREAVKQGQHIVVIATGGKLIEYCTRNYIPHIIVPKGLQPRNAIAYLFFPMIRVLENSGIIANKSAEVAKTIDTLKKNRETYDVHAQEIAEKLVNTLPIIYSSTENYSIAYRWKCEFNENAKIIALCNKFPELNHNEFNGFVNYANQNIPLHIIILKDSDDHKRIIKRMDITKRLIKDLSDRKIGFTEVHISGESRLAKLFSTIYLGDLVSYYLALKYATDPTPVDMIERFKKEMGPFI